jgi:hypothetical protein
MADDSTTSHPSDHGTPERARGSERGSRPSGPREGGGFRIRLSDNEMQAARALQEAFGLRSTVAVLGFSLRTLAQQLENGELEELVARQRAQGGRPPGPRGGGRRERGDGAPRGEGGGSGSRGPRIDPFARPSRPAPAPASEEPAATDEEAAHGEDTGTGSDALAAEIATPEAPGADAAPLSEGAEAAESGTADATAEA